MKKNYLKYCGFHIAIGLVLTSCSSFTHGSDQFHLPAVQSIFSNNNSEFLPSLNEISADAFRSRQALNWWENFEDPFLDYLVYETFQKSYDIRRSLTDVEQAEAILRGVRADLLPRVNANSQIGALDFDDIDLSTGLSGEWDLDLFGQTRQTVKQAQTNVAINQALARDVRRLVVTRLVQTYITYRTTEGRIDLSQSNLDRLLKARQRINRLVQSGYSSRLDLDRAETQISQLQSNMSALEAQKVSTRNALAIFMQVSPETLQGWLSSESSTLKLPQNIAPPSLDYIARHRPDIRVAEWSLVSATQGRRAAQMALYPDITLDGDIFSISALSNLTDFGSVTSTIAANIVQPLFGRGRLLAGIDLESARVKQALLNYEETVFQAALDIDTSLATWDRRQKQLAFDQKTLTTATEAQKRAQKLFFAGEESYTAVIVAENTRLAAEDRYLISRLAAFESYIDYSASTVPNW